MTDWFQKISSIGIDATHTPRTVAALVLVGSLIRMRSLEQLEGWIRRGRLRRFSADLISADTIRLPLITVAPTLWHDLLHQIVRQLTRTRTWPTLGGFHVAAGSNSLFSRAGYHGHLIHDQRGALASGPLDFDGHRRPRSPGCHRGAIRRATITRRYATFIPSPGSHRGRSLPGAVFWQPGRHRLDRRDGPDHPQRGGVARRVRLSYRVIVAARVGTLWTHLRRYENSRLENSGCVIGGRAPTWWRPPLGIEPSLAGSRQVTRFEVGGAQPVRVGGLPNYVINTWHWPIIIRFWYIS